MRAKQSLSGSSRGERSAVASLYTKRSEEDKSEIEDATCRSKERRRRGETGDADRWDEARVIRREASMHVAPIFSPEFSLFPLVLAAAVVVVVITVRRHAVTREGRKVVPRRPMQRGF